MSAKRMNGLHLHKSGFFFAAVLLMLSITPLSVQSERDTSRDKYRNPYSTLEFFGLNPEMDVLEISPGGGWYTEVLAPYLEGTLFAAHFNPDGDRAYYKRSRDNYVKRIESDPELFKNVSIAIFDADQNILTVDNDSVDAVLTFRNVHSWLRSNSESNAFALFFKALKPGGILGIVQHRAKPGTTIKAMKNSGYVTEEYVIELAKNAGFVFEASSEINSNEKDTTDHPKGVWTLPPSLSLGDSDKEFYLSIGESDRMTLRFRKPSV